MEEFAFLQPLLLTITGLIIGALLKSLLKHSRFPYTVGLFAIGLLVGILNRTGIFNSLPQITEAVYILQLWDIFLLLTNSSLVFYKLLYLVLDSPQIVFPSILNQLEKREREREMQWKYLFLYLLFSGCLFY